MTRMVLGGAVDAIMRVWPVSPDLERQGSRVGAHVWA